MATKRGPKVEPKEINKYKVVVDDLPEKPNALVFEEPKEELMTEEQVIAQEEYINEIPEIDDLEETNDAEADKKFDEVVNTVHFKFQDEYHFGPGNGDAVIDSLPQKRKKRPEELNQSELRLYHKTGFLPEI